MGNANDPLRGVADRDYRNLIRKAVAQGWTASTTAGGHIRLDAPTGGASLFVAKTSYGGRGERNLRSLLRRHGVDC